MDCSLSSVISSSNFSRAILCYGNNTDCSSLIPNCIACFNSTLCVYCQPDLILYKNACMNCSLPFVNSTSDLSLLLLCYGPNTNCSSLIPDCLVCYNSTLCLYCSVGHPTDGGCTSITGCTSVSYIPTSTNLTEVCTVCDTPIF